MGLRLQRTKICLKEQEADITDDKYVLDTLLRMMKAYGIHEVMQTSKNKAKEFDETGGFTSCRLSGKTSCVVYVCRK